MNTGYNADQINELIENLSKSYQNVGDTISSGWPNVSNVLRENWVGEDEQSAEKTLVKRMNDMYKSAAELVNDVMTQFKKLGDSWHEMQMNNRFDNGETVSASEVNIQTMPVEASDILTYEEYKISESEDRGVKDGGASAIQSSISSYVDEIKSGTDGIVKGIDSSKAFLGAQQSTSINDYLEDFNQALQSVLTAVSDIHEGVQTLAGQAYVETERAASEAMAGSTIKEDVESSLGDMKWGS